MITKFGVMTELQRAFGIRMANKLDKQILRRLVMNPDKELEILKSAMPPDCMFLGEGGSFDIPFEGDLFVSPNPYHTGQAKPAWFGPYKCNDTDMMHLMKNHKHQVFAWRSKKPTSIDKMLDDIGDPPKRIAYMCPHCGSTDIGFDAYANWNVAEQKMELQTTFDKGHVCGECGETDINPIEVELQS